MVKKYCSESVLPGHTILKLERQALQSNPRPQGHRGLHRMLSRGRRSCSCWIASSTDEDLNDLHFALIELLDRCFLDQVPDDLVISLPLRAHLAEQFLRFLL